MAVYTLTPKVFNQFFDDNGNPLSLGFVYTYLAGTLTPLATATDVSGSPSHANPIELDAAGRCGPIFLPAASYKFILKDAVGVTIDTVDNVSAVNLNDGAVAFAGGLYSGNGGVLMATATATTLFTITAGVAARYDIAAAVDGLGVGYMSFATVVSDGVTARIVANNGANLALTLSGLNVQAAQSSGSNQIVNFTHLRMPGL